MGQTKSNSSPQKPVLSDHKRVGKRFIPPLLQTGPVYDLSWANCTLPEVLWIGLLNHHYGLKRGASLSLSLSKAAAAANPPSIGKWYVLTSAYSFLVEKEREDVLDTLKNGNELAALKSALADFIALYPECPLAFLFEGQVPVIKDLQQTLGLFQEFLRSFFNKGGTPATLAQAHSVYIGFVTNIMNIFEGVSSFDNFPEIEHYPETEESRLIGASVRATVGAMFTFFLEEHSYSHFTPWSKYFWNRGLEITNCTFLGAYET